MLLVYLVEGGGTSVELHILTTHFHRGEGGSQEVICTWKWVKVPTPLHSRLHASCSHSSWRGV